MKLWLLRHGEAGPAAEDAIRTLTARGQHDAARIGAWFRRQPVLPTVIAVSPLRRAQQTLAACVLQPVAEVLPQLAPEADTRLVLDWLENCQADCLLVGHNPHLSDLLAMLTEGHAGRHGPQLGTAHMACLEGEACLPGHMRLQRIVVPADV